MYLVGDIVKYIGDPEKPYKRPLKYIVVEVVELNTLPNAPICYRLHRQNIWIKMKHPLWVTDKHIQFVQ
jgi:hypothetical protein